MILFFFVTSRLFLFFLIFSVFSSLQAASVDTAVYNSFQSVSSDSSVLISSSGSFSFDGNNDLLSFVLVDFLPSSGGGPGPSTEPFFVGTPKILGSILNYPNPFRLDSGTEIGFYLQIPTLYESLTIRLFNMLGHEMTRFVVLTSQVREASGYYRVPLNRSVIGMDLPAGGYFYLIFYNDVQFLGKGKLAILPE